MPGWDILVIIKSIILLNGTYSEHSEHLVSIVVEHKDRTILFITNAFHSNNVYCVWSQISAFLIISQTQFVSNFIV